VYFGGFGGWVGGLGGGWGWEDEVSICGFKWGLTLDFKKKKEVDNNLTSYVRLTSGQCFLSRGHTNKFS
jgi:hypothetical protein